ncbi:hypothetical protein [Chromobacterium haemolyticum]|uniref:hypothetical protein n=1 Tax=Chromobacterium haemolyticum TaxID=394935 RepID=UPI0017473644|nr:hypothetical protein [Chromobacterium haemolyticum]QOD81910.1 hypothetical protein IEZ30_18755 [Chromobacterium haemolyticum]
MHLHLTRELAHCLNPMIGGNTKETLHNLVDLLQGQCMLIADRAKGATLEGESVMYLLQAVAGALMFESKSQQTARGAPPTTIAPATDTGQVSEQAA